MTDVNLHGPDLKLVGTSDLAPPRAPTSTQAGGNNASAQKAVPAVDVASSAVVATANSADPVEASQEQRQQQLDNAVSKLNDFVQNVQRDLQFEVDNELGQTIVRVVDQQTQEVIRQMPDDVALRLAENLQQDEPLTLFNLKV